MSNNFVINSANNVSIYNNTYKYNFINGQYTIPEGSEMCINTLVIPYSFFNVSSLLGNNTFYWTFPTSTPTFTLNATNSTTITVSAISGSSILQIGSVITCASNPTPTSPNGLIYITALGTGTGGNGTYTINQSATYTNASASTSSVVNTVSLANGFYTINDIQNALWASMKSASCFFYSINPFQNTNASLGTTDANIIYPISISTNTVNYTNQFTFQYIPTTTTNVENQFGKNWIYYNTTTGILPSTASTCSVIIPSGVTNTSTTIGNLLGFISGTYPSATQTYSGTPTILNSSPYVVLGNSLTSYTPPFPAIGSTINAIVIRCNLVNNAVSSIPDILDCSPIATTFGSNIIYQPVSENWVRLKAGSYSSMTVSFTDQNGNVIYMNDPNILLSLLIRFPEK